MLIQKNPPVVIWDDNSVFKNISFYMLSYGRDAYSIPMVAADDYLYFGMYKPFDSLYVEMANPSSVTSTLSIEYYDGSAWADVEGILDDTLSFKRSGFVSFDKPDDWESTSVDSIASFYIRIRPSANLSSTASIQGINIVFSDDSDLEGVYPGVSNYRASSESSFILRHENSRNLIVQEIRNRGFRKNPVDSNGYENVTAWDLLQHDEVRQWSIYLTMANIFSSLQSKEDGLYKQKTEDYLELAEMFKAAFYITLDRDDDGIKDASESAADISPRRLVRR
jgi:hypothetical protein